MESPSAHSYKMITKVINTTGAGGTILCENDSALAKQFEYDSLYVASDDVYPVHIARRAGFTRADEPAVATDMNGSSPFPLAIFGSRLDILYMDASNPSANDAPYMHQLPSFGPFSTLATITMEAQDVEISVVVHIAGHDLDLRGAKIVSCMIYDKLTSTMTSRELTVVLRDGGTFDNDSSGTPDSLVLAIFNERLIWRIYWGSGGSGIATGTSAYPTYPTTLQPYSDSCCC